MVWLHKNDAVEQLSENVILYDLAQMHGNTAVLSRIPNNIGGVYAWYRRFEFAPAAKNDPEVFVNYVLEKLCKDHSAPQKTRLPPAHRIRLQPENSFSKELLLKELATDSSFRQLLFMLLNNSLIFQQSLYTGKATNLYLKMMSLIQNNRVIQNKI